jgi:hypothetical protein
MILYLHTGTDGPFGHLRKVLLRWLMQVVLGLTKKGTEEQFTACDTHMPPSGLKKKPTSILSLGTWVHP